jgi:pimeloyl-ACP methyl ester carboxylesterase
VTRPFSFIAICFLLGTAMAQSSTDTFPKGEVINRVVTRADASQSYALYLPKSYDPAKPSPVVFIFEPLARGSLPVSIMHDAAEKYGYILIASNNSRNGPFAPEMKAAEAMWDDAHQRFSLDQKRTYFAGFSGGARLAVMFTARCKECAAGAVASGAGFPAGLEPKSVRKFHYFGTVGREDFNYPEYVRLEPKLKAANFTYHLRRFDGVHQWAPADIWLEAFEWFNLLAMKAGTLAKHAPFIADAYAHALAQAAAQQNDFEKFQAYSQAAADFAGLTDVSEAQKHSVELEKLKTTKELARREERDADAQQRMTAAVTAQLEALQNPDERSAAQLELHKLLEELKSKANDPKDPQQLAAKRARSQELAFCYEKGMQMIADKDYSNALLLYDVIVANAVAAPGAHLQRSRIYLLMGDKSKAIAEARLSVKDGINDPEIFSDPEFAVLKSDPEFKALLDSLHPNKAE